MNDIYHCPSCGGVIVRGQDYPLVDDRVLLLCQDCSVISVVRIIGQGYSVIKEKNE